MERGLNSRLLFFIVLTIIPFALGSVYQHERASDSCMKIYNDGGARGVFHSEECNDWIESKYHIQANCDFAISQGRKPYQEDRTACDLDFKIHYQDRQGLNEAKVGVFGVFDGHIADQASTYASRVFMDLFYVHTQLGVDARTSETTSLQKSEIMEIMGNALNRTIYDIDNFFTKIALKTRFYSGTTAVISLLFDGHVLVANVGDSKAFLCSEKVHSLKPEQGYVNLHANELTRDHTANIPEEIARIEAAGGIITDSSVGPLINGHFPMTRAIGDVPLKRYGIIAEAEITDWKVLSVKEKYLVVSSDGIFESLSTDDVCELLHGDCKQEFLLSDCVVRKAYERKSTDNLSVIVVPLITPHTAQKDEL